MCKETGLRIVNGRTVGDTFGAYTCYRPAGKSVVDFCLLQQHMLKNIRYFKIDTISEFSDHCLIEINLKYTLASATDNVAHNCGLHPLYPRFLWTPDKREQYELALLEDQHISFLSNAYGNDDIGVENALSDFVSLMVNAGNTCLDIKQRKTNKNKNKSKTIKKPWFTGGCQSYLKELKCLAQIMKTHPDDNITHSKYFKIRKEYKQYSEKKKEIIKITS